MAVGNIVFSFNYGFEFLCQSILTVKIVKIYLTSQNLLNLIFFVFFSSFFLFFFRLQILIFPNYFDFILSAQLPNFRSFQGENNFISLLWIAQKATKISFFGLSGFPFFLVGLAFFSSSWCHRRKSVPLKTGYSTFQVSPILGRASLKFLKTHLAPIFTKFERGVFQTKLPKSNQNGLFGVINSHHFC